MNHLGPTLRRTRRSDRPGWRTLVAIALSLVVNVLALTQLDLSILGLGKGPEVRPVEMSPLAATDWEANRRITDGSPPPPPANLAPRPPEPPPPPPNRMPGQVVDVAPSKNNTPPKDTRFVSDRDNTVEKETRSRFARAGYGATLPVPVAGVQKPDAGAVQGEDGQAEKSKQGKAGARAAAGQKLAMARPAPAPETLPPGPGGDVAAPTPEAAAAAAAQRDRKPGDGAGGERKAGKFDPRLSVPASTFARLVGGPAPDHLKDVEEGDGTYLNTREWKYATYFNRIKQAVASSWEPQKALELRDPDGAMYGFKDRYTLLTVTLDDAGGVKALAVQKTSGVDFIDRTAIDAFKRAQPFANPPAGIVDANGEIRFQFGFYLEMGRSGLRIYRSPTP